MAGSAVIFDFPLGAVELDQLRLSAAGTGFFYARHPRFDEARCLRAIAAARAFFALPSAEKQRVAIEHSPHFRGYSEMRNERDWREQIHFSREEAESSHSLAGPNLWPEDPVWRDEILQLMADFEAAGRDILRALAASVSLPLNAEEPYVLLKLIHYLRGDPRSGVAPHVDFSWITLLLQDDTGGLEVRTPGGEWLRAAPTPGTLVIHIGEILQFATGGYFAATPHRVTTGPSARISLPFFLNPGLIQRIEPAAIPFHDGGHARDESHVHRVLAPDASAPFVFGDAEWRRKGEGVWCRDCVH